MRRRGIIKKINECRALKATIKTFSKFDTVYYFDIVDGFKSLPSHSHRNDELFKFD